VRRRRTTRWGRRLRRTACCAFLPALPAELAPRPRTARAATSLRSSLIRWRQAGEQLSTTLLRRGRKGRPRQGAAGRAVQVGGCSSHQRGCQRDGPPRYDWTIGNASEAFFARRPPRRLQAGAAGAPQKPAAAAVGRGFRLGQYWVICRWPKAS
jgi:hypothetical protein